jgi:CHAT domain-containing protein/Tfp pilus assembly protein PilF
MHNRLGNVAIMLVLIGCSMQILASDSVQTQSIQTQKAEAEKLLEKADQLYRVSRYQEALIASDRALAIYTQIKDIHGQGTSLISLGNVYNSIGEYQKAIYYLNQALVIFKQIGDPYRQGTALNILGIAYNSIGESQKAIYYLNQALVIAKRIGDRDVEGNVLGNLGNTYHAFGKYQEAIVYYQQALVIFKKIGDPFRQGTVLNNLGTVCLSLAKYQESIDYFQNALTIAKRIGDRNGEGNVLGNLGLVYNHIAEYQKAIEYSQKSLTIFNQIGARSGERNELNNLAVAYYSLGEYKKAFTHYQKSLAVSNQIGDNGEGGSLIGVGKIYTIMGEYKKAIDYYQQALVISRQINDLHGEGLSLRSLGNLYNFTKDYKKAISSLQQALTIATKIGDRLGEVVSLSSLGNTYGLLKDYKKAIHYHQQALVIARQIGDRDGVGVSLNNLAATFKLLSQPALAIIFYKQAVNTYETIRKDIRGLPKELQNSYKETVAGSYRQLAALLLQQNRVLEAQRVLDLLKVQELDEFLRGVRGNTNTQRGIENLPPEQQINQGYQKLIDQAVAIGKELTELRRIKPQERTITQEQRIAQLDQQETELVKAFTKFIDSEEVKTLLKKLEAIAFNQQDLLGRLSEFNALQDNLRNLQQDAVLLYPLILENRLELVLVTPYSPPIRRTVNVTSKELNQTIVEFRSALENPRTDATKPAQKLYDWLIKPIEKDLDTANTKTIIYAPDGQLRYIPLAALHNGKQWLVERYRVNNITAASLTDLNTKPQRELSVLAGAYTTSGKKHNFAIGDEQFNFAGLPYAEMEVTKLAETISETTQLRDEGFSFKATKPKMDDYAIVHFATHAAFLKGQPEKSFILFGNGDRISLTDIKEGAFGSLKKVDLFVLSACETGVGGNFGTGAEILGFGYLMQTTGARAAIASLWKVNDSGTQALMNTFYATLANSTITKAEALRQAQMALITGDYKNVAGSRGNMVAIEQRIRQGLPNDVANNLSHPYYWSSFILIGNGL